MEMTMPIRLGNKADGDDFFDREREREDLWRHLEGNHIVLSGPRRLGKTSLLQRLAEEAAAHGLVGRLVDVGGLDSTAVVIDALDRTVPDQTIAGHLRTASKAAGDWLARVRKVDLKLPGGVGGGIEVQAPPEAAWSEAARRLQGRLSAAPVLLLIDEVSVFLEKALAREPSDTVRLLSWLRAWRQESELACRFLFSGSIGLNALLARHGLTTYFNDCHDFRLGPFTEQAALAMLATECEREHWTLDPETLPHLCRRAGWLSPFYLNLLLDSALSAARDRRQETGTDERRLLPGDVDDAYDRLLAVRSRFVHWYLRLERDLAPPDLALTLRILGVIATAEDGLTRRQLLSRLDRLEPDPDRRAARLDRAMMGLEEDGYLDASGPRIQFPSFLLRDYWRRNHGR
jgi:uncharacterized protein